MHKLWSNSRDVSVMTLVCKSYTTPGHLPRLSKYSVFGNKQIDIAYDVWESTATSAVAPQDRINLVFAHGSQLCKEVWNYIIELMFAHYGDRLHRAIAIDALNSGESARLNKGKIGWHHAWPDLARDNISVIKDVIKRSGPIVGPLFAIGHSMGGSEVLLMANLDPALFAGIIVMDPVWGSHNSFASLPAQEFVGILTSKVLRGAQDEFNSYKEYNDFMNKKYVSRLFHPRIKQDVEKALYFQSGDKVLLKADKYLGAGAYAGAYTMVNHSVTTLGYTPVPALVVHGDIDDWNPPGSNEDLVETLPLGEEAIVQGGGHIVFYMEPEATVVKIYPFIDKVVASLDKSVPKYEDRVAHMHQFIKTMGQKKPNL